MKLSLYMNDYETEKLFSYLRWIFLVVALVLFKMPNLSSYLELEQRSFNALLTLGILYMTISQIALLRINSETKGFAYIVRAGIVFDFIVVFWLLLLSGSVTSPLFPIIFLLVMHSTIYWKTKGAFISSSLSVLMYFTLLLVEDTISAHEIIIFSLNSCFVIVVGLFGSLIVLRERKHFKQKEIYYELMVTDYLTGLYNHRSFQEELEVSFKKEEPFILVMGDIDHFKSINDRYGHMIGDEVLSKLGKLLSEVTTKYKGKAFRYGGEEFAFILPAMKTDQLMFVLEDLYGKINQLTFTSSLWTVTMSFGIAFSSTSVTRDEILSKADQCLYEAKKQGKNRAILETGHKYLSKLDNNIPAIKSM
ncbi:diguanylate cyclase [Cytobacillus sp. FJAT-54145]|uniref:Diguanylate cyclase n=1 Tax=Cytobacillus spartinae TaxID=3299023 RepID=A0ABW6K8J2_9BACI